MIYNLSFMHIKIWDLINLQLLQLYNVELKRFKMKALENAQIESEKF